MAPTCQNAYNGTTPNFKEIFLGRCFYFLNILQKDNCKIDANNYDCGKIFDQLSKTVLNKDPCQITEKDYEAFLSMTYHDIGANNTLFWSGTYNPAHQSKLYLDSCLTGSFTQAKLTKCFFLTK